MEQKGPNFGFVLALAALGVFLAAAIYQVPQPLRGVIVALIVFMLTVGSFVLRLVTQVLQYKAMQLSTGKVSPPRRKRRERGESARSLDRLRIVTSAPGEGQRNVIR